MRICQLPLSSPPPRAGAERRRSRRSTQCAGIGGEKVSNITRRSCPLHPEELRGYFESYGERYAQADISAGGWFTVFGQFRRAMGNHIFDDYAPNLAVVVGARNGMDALLDFTMAALGEG